MGSKQALSNGNEVEELIDIITAFEKFNSMRTAIVLYVVQRAGKNRLLAGIGHRPAQPLEQVLLSWGSSQYVYEADDVAKLMALLTRLTYGLDFELAEDEFRKTLGKSA